VGTRWSVRTALAVGAIGLSPVLGLFARAALHHDRAEQSLLIDTPGLSRSDS